MKANEARKLTDSYSIGMEQVYKKIKAAATNGNDSVNVGSRDYNPRDVLRVIAQLKNDGYTVKREQGYDQRDNESWDYLTVSW